MTPTTEAVAARFCAILRSWLSPQQLQEINEENRLNPGFCATHDYCDPNQAMIDAWEIESGREWSSEDGECYEITEAAWPKARESGFSLTPAMSEGEQLRFILRRYQDEEELDVIGPESQVLRFTPEHAFLIIFKRLWREYQARVMNGFAE